MASERFARDLVFGVRDRFRKKSQEAMIELVRRLAVDNHVLLNAFGQDHAKTANERTAAAGETVLLIID